MGCALQLCWKHYKMSKMTTRKWPGYEANPSKSLNGISMIWTVCSIWAEMLTWWQLMSTNDDRLRGSSELVWLSSGCCRTVFCWLVVSELLLLTGCLWAGCCWLIVSELPVVDWLSLSWLLLTGCLWAAAVEWLSLSCLLLTDCCWAGCSWLLVVNCCCWIACCQLLSLNCCWIACCQLLSLNCLLCWTACCQLMPLSFLCWGCSCQVVMELCLVKAVAVEVVSRWDSQCWRCTSLSWCFFWWLS